MRLIYALFVLAEQIYLFPNTVVVFVYCIILFAKHHKQTDTMSDVTEKVKNDENIIFVKNNKWFSVLFSSFVWFMIYTIFIS